MPDADVHGLPRRSSLPDEVVHQIAQDAKGGKADEFGVRQVELFPNSEGKVYCLLDAPDADAVRSHHASLGVPCGPAPPLKRRHLERHVARSQATGNEPEAC